MSGFTYPYEAPTYQHGAPTATYTTGTNTTTLIPRPANAAPCTAQCPSLPLLRTPEGWYTHFANSPHHHFCRGCERHFPSHADLSAHRRSAHQYCKDCDHFFINVRGLYEHHRQASAHQTPTSRYVCAEWCGQRFEAPAGLEMHRRAAHGVKEVECPLKEWTGCGRVFGEAYDAVKHVELRGCARGFKLKYNRFYGTVNFHNTTRGGGVNVPEEIMRIIDRAAALQVARTFPCAACAKTFSTQSGFLEHVFSAHSALEGRELGREMLEALQDRLRREEEERVRGRGSNDGVAAASGSSFSRLSSYYPSRPTSYYSSSSSSSY